jgi:ribosomal protein S18 acetylase RimI-like enzyme
MNSPIIQLPRSQTLPAVEVLAAAFSADPVIRYFLPPAPIAARHALQQLCYALIRFSQPYQHLYTTAGDVKGIAIWLPPEASPASLMQLWHLVTSGLLVVPLWMRWDRWVELISFIMQEANSRQRHVSEPHWYLNMLGVAPNYQGQGIGSQLLTPVLRQADCDRIPCYLETSTESAVRFYCRHGFEILATATLAETIPYWIMKRNPKSPQSP